MLAFASIIILYDTLSVASYDTQGNGCREPLKNIDVFISSYTNLREYNEYSHQSIFFIDAQLFSERFSRTGD